jgi:hypothetical protein
LEQELGGTLTFSSVYNTHNQLTVLQNNFTAVFGLYPLGLVNTGIFVVSVNIFMAVVMGSGRAVVLATIILILTNVFVSRFAQVHSRSEEAIASWKFQHCPRWFSKFQESARPVRINMGSFFFIDETLVLTIISIIATNATNMILGFKKASI